MFDHITPVLRHLHWLPVCQRITFRLAMITFKCLCGLVPSYLAGVCIPVSSVVGSTGGSCGRLTAGHSTHHATYQDMIGRRDFAVSGPATWNSLPVELRISSLSSQMLAKKAQLIIYSAASASEDFCI